MLPFGSITSIIPLSVLAIAYALFICASALNRIKPATDTSPEKEIIVRAGAAGQSAKTNIHYNDVQDIFNPEENLNATYPPEWFCVRMADIPPDRIYPGFCNFTFSRPPPSLFS